MKRTVSLATVTLLVLVSLSTPAPAGELTGALNLADIGTTFGGAQFDGAVGVRSGSSVSSAGDFNGDGVGDILIGAPSAGEIHLVYGRNGQDGKERLGDSYRLSDRGTLFDGAVFTSIDHAGFSVSGAGDVNGDGIDDIFIGAPRANPNGRSLAVSHLRW